MLSGMIGFVVEARFAPEKATIRTALPQHLNHGSQLSEVVMPKKSRIERFWEKVQKTDTCWNWIGSHDRKRYGFLWDGDANVRVHRWAYEYFVGPIPKSLTIDHLCRNPSCVNPEHLEIVTNRENILRGEGIAGRNARKTHCKRGHAFTKENTNIENTKYGAMRRRRCRICRNQLERECRKRKRVFSESQAENVNSG